MPSNAAAAQREAPVPGAPVILHVEDEEATRFVVRRVLEVAGFQVRSARNTAEGMALLDGADVAVLDMNLPDGTGLDLCRTIKRRPRDQRIPVMILSATSIGAADRARGLDMGADAYLTHPVEPMVLVATVRALVRARCAEHERDLVVARLKEEIATTRRLLEEREDLLGRERASRERLRSIYESPLIGIMWARRDGIFEANDEFLRMVGYTRADLAFGPLDWRRMTPPEYAHLDERAIGQIAASGRCEVFEKEYLRKDGSRVPVEIGAVGLGPDELACFVLDITERRKAEEVQKELLGVVSHDLRTPLMVVQTSVDLLERLQDPAQRVPVRARIRSAAARIDRIISDLLDFSRVERAGGIPVQRGVIDLDAVCRAVIAEVHAAMPDRRVEMTSTGSGMVVGDAARLAQLVDNLVSNAVKFSPPGSPVCVHRGTEDGRCVLRVANAGAPIPPESQAHVFDAFYRVPQAQRGVRPGSGLGLFIARAIATAHGGSIALARSDEEHGTEFRVELPLAEAG